MDRDQDARTPDVGEAFVAALADRGLDYFFGNAGTDFPAVIEAFARFAAEGRKCAMPITVPHENTAMGMAYGYYAVTGRPQAVMVHTTPGTANAVLGLMNAARQNVPILLMAGRTPITEDGQRGSRNRVIQWAQESFDQASMLREYVKWDYELRSGSQIDDVIDRAWQIAMSEPRGPIYLSLPREVLAQPASPRPAPGPRAAATPTRPDAAAIAHAAELIAAAKFPVIVTTTVGRYREAVPLLAKLADAFAIPVVMNWARFMNLPTEHAMHLGFAPEKVVPQADLVIALDTDVPWTPATEKPGADVKVVHIGADPLYAAYPMRSFRADLAIAADPALALKDLHEALAAKVKSGDAGVAARREKVAALRKAMLADRAALLAKAKVARPLSPAFVTDCVNTIKDSDTILVNESPVVQDFLRFDTPGQFFSASPVGGLGWGLGTALGVKLAARDKTVITCCGDGAYIFGNPTSAHFVSRAHDLPTLTVIYNNRMWAAVSRATKSMYPNGFAAKSNQAPLTHLEPTPDYEKVVTASGGHGEQVDSPDDLMPALQRALKIVREEKRQAVVNVLTQGV